MFMSDSVDIKLKKSSIKKFIIYKILKAIIITNQLPLIMFDLNIYSFLSKFAVHYNAI